MALPESYAAFSLPEIKFSHHPASSPTPTPVIIVSLHRPQAKNAFTQTMAYSLERAFNLLSRDPRVRCVVLTGSDPANRIFCAGMDLSSASRGPDAVKAKGELESGEADDGLMAGGPEARAAYRDFGGIVTLAIYNCQKPVIAAVNGSAVGIGATMILPANIRVVSETARIGFGKNIRIQT
jgi:enoyl-CoA hydratase/carnithine racemase